MNISMLVEFLTLNLLCWIIINLFYEKQDTDIHTLIYIK